MQKFPPNPGHLFPGKLRYASATGFRPVNPNGKMRQVNWTTDRCTINSLPVSRTRLSIPIAEKVVGVQFVVSQEEEQVTVKLVGAGLQSNLDVAAAVASL